MQNKTEIDVTSIVDHRQIKDILLSYCHPNSYLNSLGYTYLDYILFLIKNNRKITKPIINNINKILNKEKKGEKFYVR